MIAPRLFLCVFLFTGAVFAAAPPAALTVAQREQMAERDRLLKGVNDAFRAGKLDAAIASISRALAIERKVHGGLRASSLGWLAGQARLQEQRELWAGAEAAREEVLKRLSELHGKGDWRATDARLMLADTRLLAKMDGSQREQYRRAEGGNREVARMWQRGDREGVLALAQETLAVQQKLLGAKHPMYATGLNNLASLYHARGEHRKALPLFQQALKLVRDTKGERHPDHAACLRNLAALYREMGEYGLALPLFEQALKLHRELLEEKHPDRIRSLLDLAALHQDRGAGQKALPFLEQALKRTRDSLGEWHPLHAAVLRDLGRLYFERGEVRRALPLYEKALAIRRERLGSRHPEYVDSLSALAELYRSIGEFAKALPLAEEAWKLRKELWGEKDPGYADSLNTLAGRHVAMGDVRKARPLYEEAVRLIEIVHGQKHLKYGETLVNLALVHRTLKDEARAEPLLRQALALKHKRLGDLRRVLSERQWRQVLSQWRHYLDLYLNVANNRDAEAVYGEVLVWQAISAVREFARETTEKRATPARIAKALPDKTAFIHFLTYVHFSDGPPRKREPRLVAFVVTKGNKPVSVELGPMVPIAKAVVAWRQAILAGKADSESPASLRKLLWQPLEKGLAGMTTVLIEPDGILHVLPFAALPGKRPKTFLFEEVAIGFTDSFRVLEEPAKGKGKGMLLLADLDYGKPEGKLIWKARPGTKQEAAGIAAAFRTAFPKEKVTQLTGEAGTKAALLAAIRSKDQPRYLHLATHGYSLSEGKSDRKPDGAGWDDRKKGLTGSPLLRCGLVLAGANKGGGKSILTAEEVVAEDLRGVELVVLSADETALGEWPSGEGIYSMASTFHKAGVSSVLSSLWRVEDEAAKVLMVRFYEELWRNKRTKLEALRAAQLFVLKNPGKVRAGSKVSTPTWWAGWVLSGMP
jgi:CHAT domain-containing protein